MGRDVILKKYQQLILKERIEQYMAIHNSQINYSMLISHGKLLAKKYTVTYPSCHTKVNFTPGHRYTWTQYQMISLVNINLVLFYNPLCYIIYIHTYIFLFVAKKVKKGSGKKSSFESELTNIGRKSVKGLRYK